MRFSAKIVETGLAVLPLLFAFSGETLLAQEAESEQPAAVGAGADAAVAPNIDSLTQAIADLKTQLDAQAQQITQLQTNYSTEVDTRQQEIDAQNTLITDQATQIETQRQAMQSLQQQVDQMQAADQSGDTALTDEQRELRSRMETLEGSIQASENAESTLYDLDSFPGSLPIPGTSAAFRVGGFVKMNVVETFDPLGADDRFIVGTIPVPQEENRPEAALTADQTRLNLDLRDTTSQGSFRAFVEGDFAGSGDTFRLRHAFGQYQSFLLGKTWSTFMDPEARPEDIDFEGINGQILVRQPQIRYFPTFAQVYNLLASIEDPSPVIGGGEGISQIPDLIVSGRRTWFDTLHLKTSLLLRTIEATCTCLNGAVGKTNAWGLSFSGKLPLKWWDERDNFMFQVSSGEGYGRYVNDLGEIGQPDAIFNPTTGDLVALPVLASYIAMQKWWGANLRSNINFGYVKVDNVDFQPDAAYRRTRRLSLNTIWSPAARVDLGAEFLYGQRKNKDGQSATARQLQFSATYRY